MSKIKALILASTFPRWENDSIPVFILDLAKGISFDEAIDVLVAVPHYPGIPKKETLEKNIKVERVQYFWPAKKQTLFYLEGGAASKKKNVSLFLQAAIYSIRVLFKSLVCVWFKQYTVINAHWLIPHGLIAILVGRLSKAKVIVTVHGGDVFTMNGAIGSFFKYITLKYADTVTVNSSSTREACQKIYPEREYVMAPMGIDTNKFIRKAKNETSSNTVLFVGRIVKQKGLSYLIDAMDGVDAKLKVVGSGPELDYLKSYAKSKKYSDRIEFYGWVNHEELAEIYANSSVFVAPSITLDNGWREGMGLVYLEALSCGLPVITTQSTGAKDFVLNNVNGYIVDEKSSEKLSEAVNKVFEDSIDKHSFDNQLEHVLNFYSWTACSLRYKNLYLGLENCK